MHARWLFSLLFYAVILISSLRAERDNRLLENVPFLSDKRIESHTSSYRKKLSYLWWSKRLVGGGCGIVAGTYLISHAIASFSADKKSSRNIRPSVSTPLTSEEASRFDTHFKQEQLKVWHDAEKERAYKNSFTGLFIKSLRWTLMTSLAFACAHGITHGTQQLRARMKKLFYYWWYTDVTVYYHETFAGLSEQARCIMQLLKLLQQGDTGVISPARIHQRALLHRKELLVFYSFFLRTVEHMLAIMLLIGKEELSFHIHTIVHGMHEASSVLQEYMKQNDGNAHALDSFLFWFDTVMYALEGASHLMVVS